MKTEINEWLSEGPPIPEAESQQTENALIQFAEDHSVDPPSHLRERILKKISALEYAQQNREPLQLNNLPLLDEFSNWMDWQEAVKSIEPPSNFSGVHLHKLDSSEDRQLFVAWVKEYIEEEVHQDILESFILLEGTCECHITDEHGNARVVRMGVGDFITMNIGETHDVIITSLEPAKAILQWKKIA